MPTLKPARDGPGPATGADAEAAPSCCTVTCARGASALPARRGHRRQRGWLWAVPGDHRMATSLRRYGNMQERAGHICMYACVCVYTHTWDADTPVTHLASCSVSDWCRTNSTRVGDAGVCAWGVVALTGMPASSTWLGRLHAAEGGSQATSGPQATCMHARAANRPHMRVPTACMHTRTAGAALMMAQAPVLLLGTDAYMYSTRPPILTTPPAVAPQRAAWKSPCLSASATREERPGRLTGPTRLLGAMHVVCVWGGGGQ